MRDREEGVVGEPPVGEGQPQSGTATVVVGLLSIVTLLPLTIAAVGDAVLSAAIAGLLLPFAALVRPEGTASPLRWIPIGFGSFALVAGLVSLFT
jgi:hypothetical protein